MKYESSYIKNIRNFCIIAHVDHGKSTLTRKIISFCNSSKNNLEEKIDSIELEKKMGITIKSKYINVNYFYKNDKYTFNIIDTPGHSDFTQEINKLLFLCDGALLLIDASKGIQSQTIINYNKFILNKIKIILILNKIDLNNLNIDSILNNIEKKLNYKKSEIILCSAKKEIGIYKIIKSIINKLPYPNGNINNDLYSRIIEVSIENNFELNLMVYIKNGFLLNKDYIKIVENNYILKINKIFILNDKKIEISCLKSGEIGWINISNKYIKEIKSGYSIINKNCNFNKFINKNKKISHVLYVNIFPEKEIYFNALKDSIIKIGLNDIDLYYEIIYFDILGKGIKCGFSGKLHLEIVKNSIINIFKINIIITNSNLIYKIYNNKNNIFYIEDINKIPKNTKIIRIDEPIAKCSIITPNKYLGKIISLCKKRRCENINIFNNNNDIKINFYIPIVEIIISFIDDLKIISNGYALFNYSFYDFKKSNSVFINVLINNVKINLLSTITHKNFDYLIGKNIINKLILILKRKQFDIKIQILSNKNIICKHIIKQFKKNVVYRCGGGDINRKLKLINKQKKGKKKNKKNNKLNISKFAIKNILSTN